MNVKSPDPMDTLRARVAALGPEQREAFRRELEARGISWDRVAPTEAVSPRPDRLPLTPGQMHFWVQQKLFPESSAYHIAFKWRFRGRLDREALERSLQKVVDRHKPLRTAFPFEDGEVWQSVSDCCDFRPGFTDLSGSAGKLDAAVTGIATEPFDLTRAPLFRAHLLRLGEDDHLLVIVLHHIVADGWSRGILMRELTACYRAFCGGAAPKLDDLPRGYGDCVMEQQTWMQGANFRRQKSYWQAQLSDLKDLELPADRSRHSTMDMRSATFSRILLAGRSGKVARLANRLGTTSFIVLSAAFKLLLHRYCGQTDLSLSIPVAGRPGDAEAKLIGLFTNTVVLRTELDPRMSFAEYAAKVQESFSDALDHQDFPFPLLAETLGLSRDGRQSPLTQTLFQVQTEGYRQQNSETVAFGVPGLDVSQHPVPLNEAKVDLSWHVMEREDGYLLSIEYRAAVFDGWRIERMAAHFEHLVDAILETPEAIIPQLAYMSEEERHELIALGTPEPRPLSPVSVSEVLSGIAGRMPDAAALHCEGRTWSYRELDEAATSLARHLVAGPDPIGPGDRVAVSCPGKAYSIVSFLALLKAGAIYVPLDPRHPADRLAYVLEDAGVTLVLSDQPSLFAGRRCLDPSAIGPGDPSVPLPAPDPSRLAYLLYTSGSTGRPNGVPVDHASLLNHFRSIERLVGLRPGDRMLAITTQTFDISILEMLLPLSVGATVVLFDQDLLLAPARLAEVLRQERITHMQATPAYWRMLLDSGWEGDPELTALCGGEALDVALARRLLERTGVLWNVYGPTEATIWASALRVLPEHVESGKVPIGGLLDNTHLYVLDSYLQPVPRGNPGELYIGGVCLSPGYWRRPALAAAKFVPDPFRGEDSQNMRLYRTGDAVVRLKGEEIEFVGRTDFQVKLRGYRIEIGEIEECLLREATVDQAVITLDQANERLVAYVVLKDSTAPADEAEQSLRRSLSEQLPRYMVPTAFVIMDRFPLNTNGKIDRRSLPAPDAAASSKSVPAAPRTDMERKLLAIWKAVLGRDDIGVEDNFFDLGGDSIIGVRIVARAHKEGLVMAPTQIFEHQTVAAQAVVVRPTAGTARFPPSIWQNYLQGAGLAPWLVVLPWRETEATTRRCLEAVAAHHPVLRGGLDAGVFTAADVFSDEKDLGHWARAALAAHGGSALGARLCGFRGQSHLAIAIPPLLLDTPSVAWLAEDLHEAAGRISLGADPLLRAPGDYEGWLAGSAPATRGEKAAPLAKLGASPSGRVETYFTFLNDSAADALRTTARQLETGLELMVVLSLARVLGQRQNGETMELDLLTASRADKAQARTLGNFTRLLPLSLRRAKWQEDGPGVAALNGAFAAAAGQGLDPAGEHTAEIAVCWTKTWGGALNWLGGPEPDLPEGYGLAVVAKESDRGLDLMWRYDPQRFRDLNVESLAEDHLDVLTAIEAGGGMSAAKVDRLLAKLKQRKG